MSSVPVSINELEQIIGLCARDLIEKWAVEDVIPDEKVLEYTTRAIDTTSFVVDKFMGYMNDIMEKKENSL